MPVPLGKAIRWSQMDGDMLLKIATPTEEEIAEARERAGPAIRPFLEARLKPVESDLISGPAT